MNLLSWVKDIFKPAAELVDALHTSEEEKLTAKAALLGTYASALDSALEQETRQLEARAKIIEAEASSSNWWTSSWRPTTMYAFLIMLVTYWYGIGGQGISDDVLVEVFGMLKLGIGGYIGSRGVEKVASSVVGALKSREQ